MTALRRIVNPEELNQLTRQPALPPFDPDTLVRHKVDAHWVMCDEAGAITARCSLWWRQTPVLAGHRLGLIGHYAAHNPAGGVRLLEQACAEFRARCCTLAVGPMDGNTWRNYRFVTESNGDPKFFLEPQNPPDWPRHFIKNGFTAMAEYHSASTDRLDYEDPKAAVSEQRLAAFGVEFRNLNVAQFDEEILRIHQVVATAFRGSVLYHSMPVEEFLDDCRRMKPFLRPELCWMAEHEGRLAGFIFTLPDALQTRSDLPVDTAIIKTLAVLPDRKYAGLGSVLTRRSHRAARELGFRKVIHALMHESNRSRNISARYGRTFRRYTLFAREL